MKISVDRVVHYEDTYRLRLRIADGLDEVADLIAHGLCSDAGGCSLEVDVTVAANTRVEGVALGHEGVHAGDDGEHDARGEGRDGE